MGIRDDLVKAEDAVKDIITWGQALELVCESQQVTKTEAARWLLLKRADQLLTSYFLQPTIPLAVECACDDAAAYLQDIVNPSLFSFIAKYKLADGPAKFVAVNINNLDAFLQHEGMPSILQEDREFDTNLVASRDNDETLPETRLRVIIESLSGDDGYADIHALPIEAKGKLKTELLKSHPKIFTVSTFNKAWSEASGQGLIALSDKDKFTPKTHPKG